MIDEKTMLLRSAYQIAKRRGESTNWEAFENSIIKCLLENVVNPTNEQIQFAMVTPRTYRKIPED
jgi:hypothetical protein